MPKIATSFLVPLRLVENLNKTKAVQKFFNIFIYLFWSIQVFLRMSFRLYCRRLIELKFDIWTIEIL